MDRTVRGIVPVLQTPIKKRQVDVDSLQKHVSWLIDRSIGGLWVLGTGSEDMHLAFSQRLEVAKAACEANNGKVPLFLGCSFYSFYETEAFIDRTSELNFDAYHYMPYHPLLSWDRILLVYKYLVRMFPIWAYSSANWSRSMPFNFVKALKAEGVKGIKFSSQKTSDLQKVISLQSKDFQVMTAVATQFLLCLQMGAQCSTTSLAGVDPDLFIKIFRAYKEGHWGEATILQERVQEFSDTLDGPGKKHNFLSGAEEKWLLKEAGIYESAEMTFPYAPQP